MTLSSCKERSDDDLKLRLFCLQLVVLLSSYHYAKTGRPYESNIYEFCRLGIFVILSPEGFRDCFSLDHVRLLTEGTPLIMRLVRRGGFFGQAVA